MKTLVVAPHPDDELLGCGGTLLRRKAEGGTVGWLIVTAMLPDHGWPADRIKSRETEIERVAALIGFDKVYQLRLPTTRLDTLPLADIVARVSEIFAEFKPEEVLVPNEGDAHSDHQICFEAATACCKWFRQRSVRRILSYETPSETDFGLGHAAGFHPNVFVDVSAFMDRKIEALQVYRSELGDFPFPRSVESVRALAAVRGSAAGVAAAEAFRLVREVET